MKGYEKIRRCCELAASEGFEYVWIDLTERVAPSYPKLSILCINGTKMLEFVISMWLTYHSSDSSSQEDMCSLGMHVSDDSSPEDMCLSPLLSDALPSRQGAIEHKQIIESRWFSRDWTSQELLAPQALQFFNQKFRTG